LLLAIPLFLLSSQQQIHPVIVVVLSENTLDELNDTGFGLPRVAYTC